MNADTTTQAISGVQTLIYGGLISLTTTVVLAVVQAFLAGKREVFLERRAIRERFFAYDLEKFKQFEQILLDYKSVAQMGIVPNAAPNLFTSFGGSNPRQTNHPTAAGITTTAKKPIPAATPCQRFTLDHRRAIRQVFFLLLKSRLGKH